MLAFFQSTLIIFKYYAPLAREASARYVPWRNCVSIWLLCWFPRFRQVCIVQKRDSGTLYAMKYVSRSVCESRGALGGVIKEVELLSSLEHPFLVNLWFSFQGKCTTYAHTCTYSRTRADLHIRTHLCYVAHTYVCKVGGGATCLVRGGSHRSWLAIKMQMNYVHFFWCQTIHLCSLPPYLVRSSTSLILRPFICLLSPFADEEDLFMVCDLLTGGDLRYHLQNRVSVFFCDCCCWYYSLFLLHKSG